ncbi:transglycosylase SLT domain-containing protein [Streptomyces sp. NPDC053048]|uniref:transglycosylase SLT domain-containing protein n=1 Tax=Streptomyces sp. NPDC053048 TaxID=3365694 RepID=UPI0037D249F6
MKKPIVVVVMALAAIPLLVLFLIAGVVLAAEGGGGSSGGGDFSGGGGGGLKEGVGGKWRPWILKAGTLCPKASPAVLAAQLQAESNFDDTAEGPLLDDGTKALGIAQFIPSTYEMYKKDDDGNGRASLWDGGDAIMAQGRMMCELIGLAERSPYSGGTIQLALAGYNAGWGKVQKHSGIPPYGETTRYIADIMKQAAEWTVAGGGGGGGTFTDGRQTWKLNNPRSVEQAIAWARNSAGANSSGEWYNRCLAYTAIVYGWNVSGVHHAIDHFTVVPKEMQHRGDRNPPPGALMYWDTGSRSGHIAVYLGGGKIVSNDILRKGYLDIVNADEVEKRWGAKYVGWTPPYFPHAG